MKRKRKLGKGDIPSSENFVLVLLRNDFATLGGGDFISSSFLDLECVCEVQTYCKCIHRFLLFLLRKLPLNMLLLLPYFAPSKCLNIFK